VTFSINGGAQHWTLNLAAPGSPPSAAPPLARGAYENAARFGFQGSGQPGLDFSGDGRGCNQLYGRFDVLEARYGTNGTVLSFAANFEQHCERSMPALLGRIRYNSTVPLFNTPRADHDGDGKSDILWRNSSTGENYLYPMNGREIIGNEGHVRTVADLNWHVAGTGDFDGDGKADILWRNASTGQNYIYFMDGRTIKPGEGFTRTVPAPHWQVAGIGDFDGDGKADILWRNTSTGENYVFPMDGLAIKLNEGYLRTVADTAWKLKGVGDFNGDGRPDILWRNSSTGENYVYFMNGVSIVNEGYLRTVADTSWEVKGIGDFDGDGNADILWRNATSGENYAYLMNGVSIANEGYLRTVADLDWQIAAVGDYDGDGKSDIVWRNASSGENYLYPMEGIAIKPSEGYLRTVPDDAWTIVGR
jgi:hypothetical protein